VQKSGGVGGKKKKKGFMPKKLKLDTVAESDDDLPPSLA